jgi:hypothetical protein
MIASFYRHRILFILSVLILGLRSTVLLSQTDTVINRYAKVISRSDYQVTVNNASGFFAGDYALLIQMKGVSISSSNDGTYGGIIEIVGTPGQYEFIVISTVAGNTITFLSKIKNYDVNGFVQIIRVPFFNSAKFNKTLTCQKWDPATGTGGVLALIAGRDLTLGSDFDVSGKGFNGAGSDIGIGGCAVTNGIDNIYSFPATFDNAGYKGEGIASHYSPTLGTVILLADQLKGQGRLFNGGGGGNGRFSGGGGGSNRGIGHNGGKEDKLLCKNDIKEGGNGGFSVTSASYIDPSSNTGGIFMGGGGGSSTHLSGAFASAGGNGGGIIFILADSLIGNNKSLIASGDSALAATGIYSGAGGGGAGGSVIIFSKKYSTDNLKINVAGGKGGDVYHSYLLGDEGGGTGGGGGGGYVTLLKALTPNILIDSLGGPGSYIKDVNGTAPLFNDNGGSPGLLRTLVAPVLTGFLFNSISSDKTGNQIDSTCSNVPYSLITGTEPMGGVPPYTFKWQKSTLSESAGYTDIPGANSKNYVPGSLSQTTWFKRVITDSSIPVIIDNSKPVQIIVHPAIQNNNIIANPDSICINGDPQLLKQTTPDLIVPSTKYLKYIWQDSTIGGSWGPELAAETVKEFDPAPAGGLVKDTWYRRTVISGSCIDKGPGSIVKVTVIPKIGNNAFSIPNDTICFGQNTSLNTVAGPTGGVSGEYRYSWESSTTGVTGPWTFTGSTAAAFDPDVSVPLPVGNHFYRRIVFSGEQDACKDTTKPVAVRKVWPKITNNGIKADQTIGYDSIPLKLTEISGAPLGGDGLKYKYLWIKDTVNYPPAPVGSNGITQNEYQPPKLRFTVSFRRIVNSSACADTSISSVKITVDSPISNTISLANSALDIIYTGQVSSKLKGSSPAGGSGVPDDYSYKWYKSLTGGTSKSEWTIISDSVRIDLYPGVLNQPTWFRRDVSSPKVVPRSTYQSNYLKVTVLPRITNVNIAANQEVCYGYRPIQLKGSSSLTGGDGKYTFTWQDSTSAHLWQNITNFVKCDSANYKPPSLQVETRYRRIVYSGKNDCGVENSNSLIVKVNPLPVIPYAGPDTLIHSVEKLYHMLATKPPSDESGKWETLSNGTGTFVNPTSNNSVVRSLSDGKNLFLWTVNKGLCQLKDSVTIELLGEFIPQGFSPNGDAWNNTFIIEGLNLEDQLVDLSIVNSAGAEVYSTSNRAPQKWTDWDGKNTKGYDLPEGTYYYLLKITSDPSKGGTGQVFKSKGFIVLKRY